MLILTLRNIKILVISSKKRLQWYDVPRLVLLISWILKFYSIKVYICVIFNSFLHIFLFYKIKEESKENRMVRQKETTRNTCKLYYINRDEYDTQCSYETKKQEPNCGQCGLHQKRILAQMVYMGKQFLRLKRHPTHCPFSNSPFVIQG